MYRQGWVGLLMAGVFVAMGLMLASRLLVPGPPQRMALPTAGELLALEPYLDPADVDLPEAAGVPATVRISGDPFRAGPGASRSSFGPDSWSAGAMTGTRAGATSWNLSAIMIAGDRRVAILNDRMVRPGDRLDDGARVQAVEPDHIIIITSDGQRRRLDLER